jgi:transcriptional regulator with XRE-family HTH domain
VKGLRREEVALLAGISVEYYTRLERGNARGASDEVLDGICRALQLDEAERAHLFDLARAANAPLQPRRATAPPKIRPSVKRIVDAMDEIPAFVRNGRLDILHANPLAEALYSLQFLDAARPVNSARFLFLDARARTFFSDWDQTAHDIVASLRGEAGRNPHDRSLTALIGELSTLSEEFRVQWARHDVRFHRTGIKRINHPLVGELTLAYETLELPADPGLAIVSYSAEPGSRSDTALTELSEWSARRRAIVESDSDVVAR